MPKKGYKGGFKESLNVRNIRVYTAFMKMVVAPGGKRFMMEILILRHFGVQKKS